MNDKQGEVKAMSNIEEEKPTQKGLEGIRCGECGTRLKESDKECPNCGSTKKTSGPIHFVRTAKTSIGLKATASAVHKAHMSPQSWAVFGLILGFVIPPIFYAVFSILTIGFWYKLLIWLGVILIPFFLAYKYRIIWYKIIVLLRFIADKTYGKRKI